MELSYNPDFRFNDNEHKENFLNYMFVASKSQMEKHESDDFLMYVGGKNFITKGAEGLSNRKTALEILCKKEIDFNKLHKSVLMYLYDISEHEQKTIDKCFERLCGYIQKAVDKTENINYVCVTSHFNQTGESPHVHIFYECEEDIDDELQKLLYKEMKNLNK